jgi:hypothetical protein
VEVAGGGVERGVTQEHLDDRDLDAVFQAMGGEAVTQAVYSAAVGQPGLGDGAVEDTLAGGFVDGRQRFGARKEEDLGAGLAVVVAEHRQQVVAEQGVALPAALGMGDQQPMADAIQVLDLDVGGLGEAQAATIDATEEGPGAQIALGADGQELFDFGHAVEPRSQGGAAGTLDLVQERLDLALKQSPVERTHGVDGQVDGGSGLLALGNQVIKPVSNVLRPEQVGRASAMLGQRVDETDVAVNRALDLAVEREILNELARVI